MARRPHIARGVAGFTHDLVAGLAHFQRRLLAP
jgi:hypothetical protein